MKYALYARKSSESKERQALSIQDQIDECRDYATQQELMIIHTFQESKSAFKPHNREQFDLLLELISRADIEGVLAWKPDRLCRNPEEGGKLLQLLQDGKLREIRCATGEVYTQDSDHLILQIHFGMANQYSRNLSQNVRRGIKKKIERGDYPRPAPLGYVNYGDRGRRNIKPDPTKAPLVVQIFDYVTSERCSLKQVQQYATKIGLTRDNGKPMSISRIHGILKRPTYYGYFTHNGELYEGNYEPIVSKDLFDEVQTVLSDRSKPKRRNWTDHRIYRGLIQCGECGCTITSTIKRKRYEYTNRTATYTYHHCTKRRGSCSQLSLIPKELEAELIKNIDQICIDKETWELGIKLLRAKHGEEVGKLSKRLVHHQHRYNLMQDKLNRLIDMRASGEIDRDQFMVQKNLLMEEQEKVKVLMTDSEDSSHHWLEIAEQFFETAYKAKEIMEEGTSERKRELILTIGENVTLKDKKIDIQFKKPYDILLNPMYRSDVLGEAPYHNRLV